VLSIADEIIDGIVLSFARAVIDPSEWMPALQMMSDTIGSASCSLELADTNTGFASINCTWPLDEELIERYEERIYHINPRVRRARTLPVGAIANDRTLLVDGDPDMAEFLDWLQKTPNRYVQGGKLFQGDGHEIYFGSYFSADQGPPQPWHLEVHQRITPHLVNFVAAGRFLSGNQLNNELIKLEHIDGSRPFALLDRAGRIVECSTGFDEALKSSNALTIRKRRLTAIHARHRDKVDHFLASAVGRQSILEPILPIRLTTPTSPSGIILRAVPLQPGNNVFDVLRPIALVTLNDLDNPRKAKCRELVELFDLTLREAEVAALVGEGLSTVRVAQMLAISEYTVKQHLKAVFGKIGFSRQPELVAMIARLL
jgi:DNA-binding CsgD family transcriptional regulator